MDGHVPFSEVRHALFAFAICHVHVIISARSTNASMIRQMVCAIPPHELTIFQRKLEYSAIPLVQMDDSIVNMYCSICLIGGIPSIQS